MSKEPKPPTQPKGRVIYKGSVPDTDPRYASGWNYLSGKNLNLPPQPEQQASTEQKQEPFSKTRVYRVLSLAEARERGIPTRNDLVISPVPRVKEGGLIPSRAGCRVGARWMTTTGSRELGLHNANFFIMYISHAILETAATFLGCVVLKLYGAVITSGRRS
jgi:hypothetical protein